jgi:susD family
VKKGNDALNALKKARIEGWTDATYDQEALLNEIMNERERELVGEGYRLMDLKRWGKGVKRGKPQSKGLVLFPGQASTDGLDKLMDDQRMLWPIPKTEMDANPQLAGQQNPGY